VDVYVWVIELFCFSHSSWQTPIPWQQQFDLIGKDVSVTVEMSGTKCRLNGAIYFVAATSRFLSTPVFRSQNHVKSSTQVGSALRMTTTNASASVLGCGICMVAMGDCATDSGRHFRDLSATGV